MSPQDFARIPAPKEVRLAVARRCPKDAVIDAAPGEDGTAYDVTVFVPVEHVITIREEDEKP
jgi:hypothetical protein